LLQERWEPSRLALPSYQISDEARQINLWGGAIRAA
jgi:hypothetical protein